jgi:F0F1-type ATP synthase membrane subunit c/vacuolar-type H+-ATPase subunit K
VKPLAEDPPTVVYVLGILVGGGAVYQGLVDGVTGTRVINVSRERHPFWFWSFMGLYGFAAVFGLYGLIFG